jgi:hypothetical protein
MCALSGSSCDTSTTVGGADSVSDLRGARAGVGVRIGGQGVGGEEEGEERKACVCSVKGGRGRAGCGCDVG